MIYGIGLDIIENKRIDGALSANFLERVFSDREQQMFRDRGMGTQQISGCWAGKEAVIKAMGDDSRSAVLKEIEILRTKSGKPYVVLNGKTKEAVDNIGVTNIHISISNLVELVAAMVVFEKE